jgi:hypothetical protein
MGCCWERDVNEYVRSNVDVLIYILEGKLNSFGAVSLILDWRFEHF